MPNHQRTELDHRPIPSRRGRSWAGGRLLWGVLSLCAIGTAASAEPADAPGATGAAGFAAFQLGRPCPPSGQERVRAIYVDLETSLVSAPQQVRVLRQQWFCADSELLDAGSLAPGAGVRIDLISLDPSVLTVILESQSGEVWEIELARLDDRPLEPGAFASERAGFFVNGVEWTEDAELAALDADFEVDLPGGASLWGRVLWNAAWNPHEAPFVPLSDGDWNAAWPGEVSIAGSALDRLFLISGARFDPATPTADGTPTPVSAGTADGTQALILPAAHGTPGEPMDSIGYSPEPAKDTRSARIEVARDLALLAESQPTAAGSTPSGSRAGGPTAQTPYPPTPASAAWLDPQTGAITPDPVPAGIGDLEPWWLEDPDEPTPAEEPERVSAQRPEMEACPGGLGARGRQPAASEDPSPGCVTGLAPSEGAAGLEGSHREGAPLRVLEARDRAGALDEAGGSVSLEHLLEECWLALRTMAERWWQAMRVSTPGTRP